MTKEPLFSFCMPLHHSSRKSVQRAISSIIDQDYKSWELIIGINGRRKKQLIDKIKKFDDKRISYFTLDQANVCKARNEAAKRSKGEYISFFSSDFILYPGMLRLWVETFLQHPTVDFLFGGYRFTDRMQVLHLTGPWQKVDRFLLESENYIDGGMPMRKWVWETNRWDESLKSLNDWDFWLRATDGERATVAEPLIRKQRAIGHYIPDFAYAADSPKPGGLSYDSHENWKKRTAEIRMRNDIPEKSICVVSHGAPYHGIEMARILNADFKKDPHFKPNDYEMIYLLGFYLNGIESHVHVVKPHPHTPKDCLRVVHHIGGDTYQFGNMVSLEGMKRLVKGLKDNGVIHLCETEDAQKELAQYGIDAKIIPIPSAITNHKILPVPKVFRVAIYYPIDKDPTAKYLEGLTAAITQEMKDTKFILYGCDKYDGIKDGNVQYKGWVDMEWLARKCTLMVRLVRHDSVPIACTDFLRFGRPVITNIPNMSYMEYVDITPDTVMKNARDMVIERIQAHKEGKVFKTDYHSAKAYWDKLLSHETYKKNIYGLLNG